MEALKKKVGSRKFWFALLGALLPMVGQYFSADIDPQEAMRLSLGIVASYLFAQGYVDGKEKEGLPAPSVE